MRHAAAGNPTRSITVEHVMVFHSSLQRASTHAEAVALHPEYDVVPSPKKGPVAGYFEKGSDRPKPIEPRLLLSRDTPLISLPGLMCTSPFFFVIGENRIVGYVHYSDLNVPPARIPFFAAIELAERAVADQVKQVSKDSDVRVVCKSTKQFNFLRRQREARTAKNVDLGWTAVLSFEQIIRLGMRHHLLKLQEREIRLLVQLRNRVAHPTNDLVSHYEDIRWIAEAKTLAERISKAG